jgi:hypothetical protein
MGSECPELNKIKKVYYKRAPNINLMLIWSRDINDSNYRNEKYQVFSHK